MTASTIKSRIIFQCAIAYEYACHEGNYALLGILAGARAEESQGQKASAKAVSAEDDGE